MKNQKGTGVPLLLLTSGLVLFIIINQITNLSKNLAQLKHRSRALLCARSMELKNKKFINKIIWGNRIILANKFLKLAPPPYKFASNISKKSIQMTQEVMKVSHLRFLMKNKFCSKKQKIIYVRNTPFLGIKFKRNKDGTIYLRKKQWQYKIPLSIEKRTNYLDISLKLNSNLSTKQQRKVQERKGLFKDILAIKRVQHPLSLFSSFQY